jgi:hypothetical protein
MLRKSDDLDLAHVLESGTKAERMVVLLRVEAKPDEWSQIAGSVPKLLATGDIEVQSKLLSLIGARGDAALLPSVHALLAAPDDLLREQALKCVRRLDRPESAQPVLDAARREDDESLKVEMAEAALEFDRLEGVPLLFDVMEQGEAEQARRDAWEHLTAHVDVTIPFDAGAAAAVRASEVGALREWWKARAGSTHIKHTQIQGQ